MSIKQSLLAELTGRIIPFWQGLRDTARGGYYGRVDYELAVQRDAPKGSILNSRILWFFSHAYIYLKESGDQWSPLRDCADHAYRFLWDAFWDGEHGGVYWLVDCAGKPLDTTKHTYAQAFAVYGLAAYYRASGDGDALDLARRLFDIIEGKCTDGGGYGEAYDRAFAPVGNEKLSENGVMADRTMNTLLHVFEAYSGLYEAAPDERVAAAMRRVLDIYRQKVYNPAARRLEVFFDKEMNSLIDLQSYGHDIEASWLTDWGAGLLGDTPLAAEVANLNAELARSVYERAYHDGCLWNERERGVDDKNRVWWVQPEAMVGFYNAYQKTGEARYREAVSDIWRYIQANLIDKRPNGEWHWQLDENDTPRPHDIVEPWKCPYHNGRMCLELLARIDEDF